MATPASGGNAGNSGKGNNGHAEVSNNDHHDESAPLRSLRPARPVARVTHADTPLPVPVLGAADPAAQTSPPTAPPNTASTFEEWATASPARKAPSR